MIDLRAARSEQRTQNLYIRLSSAICVTESSLGMQQERHNMSEFKMAVMETEIWTAELSINRLKSLIKVPRLGQLSIFNPVDRIWNDY